MSELIGFGSILVELLTGSFFEHAVINVVTNAMIIIDFFILEW